MVRKSDYSPGEQKADALVHGVGVSLALAAAGWLLAGLWGKPAGQVLALGFYALALVGVMALSAAYHLATGPLKQHLRRLDHGMIFVMIAATYTPLVALRLPPPVAQPLGLVVGGGCLLGVLVKLWFPRRFDRLSVLLYLALGWALVVALGPLQDNLTPAAVTLLLAGGGFYTLGVPFCLLERLPYHNALWHLCVLLGAGCHFLAMAVEFG